MRKSHSAAAVAALVMTGAVPAGLMLPQVTSLSFSQLLCMGALGGEWAGRGGAGACEGASGPRRSR